MVLEYIWEIVVYRDCIKVGYMLFIGFIVVRQLFNCNLGLDNKIYD